MALLPRPGRTLFCQVSALPIIGLYRQPGTLDGLVMAVTQSALYALNDAGSVVGETPVLNLGSRVSMASGALGVLYMTDGAQLLKLTVAAGETAITVTPVAFPDFASCSWVAFLNGYFLFGRSGSHRIYFLPPGETTIDALDYFSAETAPDNHVSGNVLGDELWIGGESTVEVHTATGDPDLPFLRAIGRPQDYSLASRDTVQKLDNALCFLGADRIVYQTAGLPKRISDHGIEQELRDVPFADLISFQFAHEGHWFYCLTAIGRATLAYDIATQRWSRFASYGREDCNCTSSCALGDGRWLLGDDEGSVHLVDGDAATDAGEPIVRIASGLIETGPTVCNNVVVEANTGEAPDHDADPMMELRLSLDQGRTWTDWMAESLGRLGEYETLTHWRRLGMIKRGVAIEFRDANPVQTVIRRAGFNEVTL